MRINELRDDLKAYLSAHGLEKKYAKAKKLFEHDPFYPSLNTELLQPKERLIYSFRLDRKYRALFIYLEDGSVEIIALTNHYK